MLLPLARPPSSVIGPSLDLSFLLFTQQYFKLWLYFSQLFQTINFTFIIHFILDTLDHIWILRRIFKSTFCSHFCFSVFRTTFLKKVCPNFKT